VAIENSVLGWASGWRQTCERNNQQIAAVTSKRGILNACLAVGCRKLLCSAAGASLTASCVTVGRCRPLARG